MNLSFLDKTKTFWLLQMLGWCGLCVLTYFSLTIWYSTDKFLSNIIHIFLQAVVGLLLTLILRRIFLRFWHVSFFPRIIMVSVSIVAVAMVWNVVRMQLFIWIVVADEYPLKEHPDWVFDKASIFFDFRQDITRKQGNKYYWDNVSIGEVLLSPENINTANQFKDGESRNQLPLNFEGDMQSILLTDFGGASTAIEPDPLGQFGNVAVTTKWPNSVYWAGTTMSAGDGFAEPIPISVENSLMTVWVYSNLSDIKVRLKLESHDNPDHAMEVEKTVYLRHHWKPVVFDFNDARAGDYEFQVSQIWRDFGGWFYTAILIMMCWSAVYHLIKYAWLLRLEIDKAHDQAKEAKYKSAKAMLEAKDAQLQMLRYQLNPHFLFNTLNTVYALIKLKDVDVAKSMVAKLSQFLRNSLESDPNELVTLAQEIDAIQLYLNIEQVRFEDRLVFSSDVMPEARQCRVPGLILQPLVENSIKYAVSNREDAGVICLTAIVEDDWLEICLTDNGPGLTVKSPINESSTGIGIQNVKQRLATLYGDNYKFELKQLVPSGLKVTIRIPRSEHND